MTTPGVLIADRDSATRRQLSRLFNEAGYQVRTTDSAAEVLVEILKRETRVVLLGSAFDEPVTAAELIPLLKSCCRELVIILVADDTSLPILRRIRQEGIFYHALRPTESQGREDLRQALECAYKNVLNVITVQ
jgi:DNA-binding NtrC family response regulator